MRDMAAYLPEFLYVMDPSRGEATPVQFVGCTDEKRANTIDARTTPNDVTTTIYNDVALDRIGTNCEVELVYDVCYELMTAINVADAALVSRGRWDLRINRDDCLWVDDASVQLCLRQPVQLGTFSAGDVMVGERDICCERTCMMKPFFMTPEDTMRLRVTFPSGAAETWTLLTWIRKARYSSVGPTASKCVLVPGIAPDPAGPVIAVARSPQLMGPPTFQPGAPGTTTQGYYGVGESGVRGAGVAI